MLKEEEIKPISSVDREKTEEMFVREIKDFQREIERKKEEWKEKMAGMEKKEIKWEWEIWKGNYEGEIKDEKPHGLGKWKQDDGEWTVVGEWRDGRVNGKAVANGYGNRYEYEAKDGKENGKFIRYYSDGGRE